MGGVWEALTDRFLVGAGQTYGVESYGGTTDYYISTAQLPAHNHSVSITSGGGGNHNHSFTNGSAASNGAHTHYTSNANALYYKDGIVQANTTSGWFGGATTGTTSARLTTSSNGAHTHTVTGTISTVSTHTHSVSGNTGNQGSGSVLQIKPPYYAVYMWKRVS